MDAQAHEAIAGMTKGFARLARSFEALGDNARLANHRIVSEFGRQWEHPEAVLTDDEIGAIHARALGRTLADIDDLP